MGDKEYDHYKESEEILDLLITRQSKEFEKRYMALENHDTFHEIACRYFRAKKYMITFTLKPEMADCDSRVFKSDIIKRLKRPGLSIIKCYLVKELTKKGVVHYHAAVSSNKYICKNRFKKLSEKYGFIDISKNHVNSLKTMMKYMTKSNKPERIL